QSQGQVCLLGALGGLAVNPLPSLALRARGHQMAYPTPHAAAQPLVLTRDAPPARDEAASLLGRNLADAGTSRERGGLERFLHESDPARALSAWVGPDFAPGQDFKGRLVRRLSRDIARLDDLLNRQVNAILHHPRFQKLEASWRGLHYLIEQVPEG